MTAPDVVAKPVPVPDEQSAPFFEAAAREELLLQRCDDCGAYTWPVRPRCTACFSAALSWAPASGDATLYSYTLIHRTYDPAFAAEVPYNVALVDLPEGVRALTAIVGVAPEDLQIGMALRVVFETPEPGIGIPKFAPAGGAS